MTLKYITTITDCSVMEYSLHNSDDLPKKVENLILAIAQNFKTNMIDRGQNCNSRCLESSNGEIVITILEKMIKNKLYIELKYPEEYGKLNGGLIKSFGLIPFPEDQVDIFRLEDYLSKPT